MAHPPLSKKAQLSLEMLWSFTILLLLLSILAAALLPTFAKSRAAVLGASAREQAASQSLASGVEYALGDSIHVPSNESSQNRTNSPRLSYAPS